uniref:WRKY domain-containing protein n=1 Tax=Leersia perrieri TaxID=77586 RepID=A0A0D9WJY8_9ORYZ
MVELCGEMLASELGKVQAMAMELERHVDQDSPAAMELCRALASSVDRSIRLAASCFPPATATAMATMSGGGGNAGAASFKKRQGKEKVRKQVRVTSVQDTASLDDGLSWRKYGQKDILGAKYPRAYFRCTHRNTKGCNATKQVQRADGDPLLFDIVYLGDHTCGHKSAPPPLAGAVEPVKLPEQQRQQSSLLAAETEGIRQVVEPMASAAAPFLFTSTAAAAAGVDVDVSSYFFVSPANSDCQFSSDFSAGSVGIDMDHEARFEEFFMNTPEFFHSEIQNL